MRGAFPGRLFPFATALLCGLLTLLPASAQEGTEDFPFFPLAEGNQWALSNPWVGWPSYASVTANRVYGNRRYAWLRVDTPVGSSTLILGVSPKQITFEGVAVDGGRSWFDDGLPLFFYADPGSSQANEAASATVVSTNETVVTRLGNFPNCLHIRLRMAGGAVYEFYLAPGVGLVRLGGDEFPFLLDVAVVRPYFPMQSVASVQVACPPIGIDPNPAATQDFSDVGREIRLAETFDAGSRFLHLSATWAELEPEPGVYRFDRLLTMADLAQRYGMDSVLTLKTVDTLVAAVPADLKDRPLNDEAVLARFRLLLANLVPKLPARVRWINLANEVDTYFREAPERVMPFVDFYQAGREQVKALSGQTSVGVVFAINDLRRSDAVFRAMLALCDHVSFTYYPMRRDVTARPPEVAASDIAEAVSLAGDKPVIFTEVGYPTAETLGGGETAQAKFYTEAIAAIRSQGGRVLGASFFLMSDFPDSVVLDVLRYYGLEEDSPFRSFLASLGVHNVEGGAKPAWVAFRELARPPAECSAVPSAMRRSTKLNECLAPTGRCQDLP